MHDPLSRQDEKNSKTVLRKTVARRNLLIRVLPLVCMSSMATRMRRNSLTTRANGDISLMVFSRPTMSKMNWGKRDRDRQKERVEM